MMPGVDGFTVCQKLKQSEKTVNIPIVMCTAKGLKEDIMSAVKAGANDYIIKPFTKDTLLGKVKKFLG